MEKIFQMKKSINFLYEFKTPSGFLGVGYNIHSLPHIFEYLSNNKVKSNTSVRYSSFGKYFKLTDSDDLSHTFYDSKRAYGSINNTPLVNRKLYTDLTQEDLDISYNCFNIATHAEETIIHYICSTDLKNHFLPATLDFIKKHPSVKIILSDEREGCFYHYDCFFDNLRNFVTECNLDTVQIIYISNTADIQEHYKRYLDKNSIESFMIVKWVPTYIYHSPGQAISNEKRSTGNNSNFLPSIKELDHRRNYYFLNLNRNSARYRFHRTDFILELKKNSIFDKGIVSLLQSDDFDQFCKKPENKEYKDLIYDSYPYTIDEKDPDTVARMDNYLMVKQPWLDTYFSVVNETSVDSSYIFITEKSMRPIINFHPFIILGNPNTLSKIKQLGFKTFPELFDESYDTIEDYTARLKAVVNNVVNLCSKDREEIHKLYQLVKPKLIHNYKLLLKYYSDQTIIKEVLSTIIY